LAIWKAAKRNLQSKDADQREDGAILALELGLSPEQIEKGEVPQTPSRSTPEGQSLPGAGAESMSSQQKAMATKVVNTATKVKGG
jgi:hypothetical protein